MEMADKSFQCSIITPESQVFDDRVDAVTLPAHDGGMGVLFNRAPLVCKLGAGALRIRKQDSEQIWYVDSGFAQVLENKVIVLTQQALRPDEIDRSRAEQMLEDARQMKVSTDAENEAKAHAEARARAQLRMAK